MWFGFKFSWWLTIYSTPHQTQLSSLHALLSCCGGVSCSVCYAFIIILRMNTYYFENELLDFDQILCTHWNWLEPGWDGKWDYIFTFQWSYGPWLRSIMLLLNIFRKVTELLPINAGYHAVSAIFLTRETSFVSQFAFLHIAPFSGGKINFDKFPLSPESVTLKTLSAAKLWLDWRFEPWLSHYRPKIRNTVSWIMFI